MNDTTAYERITSALEMNDSRKSGTDYQCPAHPDRTPSLSVNRGNKGVLIYCQAGCETEEVVSALGLEMRDLFDDQAGSWSPATLIRGQLARLRDQAGMHPWKGRTGRTDRDVYLALLSRADRVPTLEVAISVRDIALASGVTWRTVSNSVVRLEGAGFIKGKPLPARRDMAREYELLRNCTHGFQRVSLNGKTPGRGQRDDSVQFSNNLCATELGVMLGKAAIAVYSALDDHPRRVTEIAGHAGVAPSTASRSLRKKLLPAGLADTLGTGRGQLWIKGTRDPMTYDPETESERGAIVAERREQYARDRAEYLEWRKWRRKVARARRREQRCDFDGRPGVVLITEEIPGSAGPFAGKWLCESCEITFDAWASRRGLDPTEVD